MTNKKKRKPRKPRELNKFSLIANVMETPCAHTYNLREVSIEGIGDHGVAKIYVNHPEAKKLHAWIGKVLEYWGDK